MGLPLIIEALGIKIPHSPDCPNAPEDEGKLEEKPETEPEV